MTSFPPECEKRMLAGIPSSVCQESVDAAVDTATSLAAERVVTAENIPAVHSANVVHPHTYIEVLLFGEPPHFYTHSFSWLAMVVSLCWNFAAGSSSGM